MKKLLSLILFLILFLHFFNGNAQSIGFEMPSGRNKIEIPFEYLNNFILVKVNFNQTLPLRFIFDTGAEHTILTKKEITDLLSIPYGRSFKVMGSDLQKTLVAHLVSGINLKVGRAEAPQQDILVLGEDYFRFEKYTGTEVHGILGADLFRRFVIKINYQRRVISLYNPKYFEKPSNKFKELDLLIHKGKPYIESNLQLNHIDSLRCKLLIDTGAGLTLLLNTFSNPKMTLPETVIESNIGAGLGGFIEGYTGRIHSLDFAGSPLNNLITSFQENTPIAINPDSTLFRNGIIGNEILNRFTMIINYPRKKLYLKPNRNFKQKFSYDKSGLTLISAGPYNNTLVVQDVLENSPASEAGIIRGDIIQKINGVPTIIYSLNKTINILRSKSGKKITLKLKRLGFPIKRELVLRDLI